MATYAPFAPLEDHGDGQLRAWILPASATVCLPFFACAAVGCVGEPHFALFGAAVLGVAAWRTQRGDAGFEGPTVGAVLAALFAGTWLYDAATEAWSALLWAAPLPAVVAAFVLLALQLARGERDPQLVGGASTVLFFAASSLAGLGLLGL